MQLNLKGFSQIVQDMGAALQSSASNLVDVSVGSVLRAIFEANASVVLWLQWLVLQVLQTTRASTCNGSDLDSWMLDFGQIRLPAVASTGVVTFSRFVNTLPVTIPVGTTVKTVDGLLSFLVVGNPSLSIFVSTTSGYLLPGGVTSADLPIICTTAGSIGNVLGGNVTVIAASLPGIDQANNAGPLAGGVDAESDLAFRKRFQSYLASRSRATLAAVENAVINVQQGLDFVVQENTAPDGTVRTGSFLIILDDGTGYPSSDLLSNVAAAIDWVRPVGTTFAVIPPQVLIVGVSLTAVLNSSTNTSTSIVGIQNFVSAYLNTLSIGGGAFVTRVAQNAYLGEPGIENITAILLNGLSTDVTVPPGSVIKAGQVVVTTNDG